MSACRGFVFECDSWCIPGVGVSPVLFRDASLARPWVCVCVGVSPLLALVLRVSVLSLIHLDVADEEECVAFGGRRS